MAYLEGGGQFSSILYLNASEIWPDKRGGLWWEWPYYRETTVFDLCFDIFNNLYSGETDAKQENGKKQRVVCYNEWLFLVVILLQVAFKLVNKSHISKLSQ